MSVWFLDCPLFIKLISLPIDLGEDENEEIEDENEEFEDENEELEDENEDLTQGITLVIKLINTWFRLEHLAPSNYGYFEAMFRIIVDI